MINLPERASMKNFRVGTFLAIAAIHILALAAPFTFTWAGLITFIILVNVTGILGIALSYHRLLTHRSYKTFKPIKYLFTFFACLALQGGPIFWVGTHRYHHKESDQELDPHTPVAGFFWAHVLWNFFTHPKLKGYEDLRRYALDLDADPVMRFFEKYFFGLFLLFTLALYGIGYHFGGVKLGLSLVIWGSCLRTVYVWHVTWLVNSASHTWGYQNYASNDTSTNLWWVALLSFGEGWHNNHHGDQRAAHYGHRWFEFDISYIVLKIMTIFGLAHTIVKPRYIRKKNFELIPGPGYLNKKSQGAI